MEKHGPTGLEPSFELPEESAEELYENAPCGYISTLPNGVLVRVNKTFLTWTGYTRDELLNGRRFQDLLAMGGKVVHETHFVPMLRMQGFANEINFDLVSRTGQPLPVLANTVVKKDAAGRPMLFRTTLFNISERKRYERELMLARRKAEDAAKAKADFLSMMSHEIRTPMNAVVGLSNLLDQAGLPPQQEKYLHLLKASSESLLNLLNDILDFSKMEAGKVTLEARGFSLRQLVEGIVRGLGVKAEQKGLSVHADIGAQVPEWLTGDPGKLGQVLTNLVGNAIKFTEQGSVTVAVDARERTPEAVSLDFRVSDTGIGIPQERLAKVFEEFTQASDDIHRKYGGTGLGLAISQKLLELHGSRMSVTSVPGEGSTFGFTLRLKPGEAQAPTGPALLVPDARTLRGVRVLVAEDDDLNVFVLSQFLRKWGAGFEVVSDGQQALERIQEAPFDVVLMDLRMPRMSGYEATRAVRMLPEERFQRLPILALTASARMNQEERAGLAGFSDLLGKPFKPEELFTRLVHHCARPQKAQDALPVPLAPPEPPAVEPPGPAGFHLEKLWDLAEGDPHAMLELGTLAMHNSEKGRRDFQQALEQGDAEAFEFHAHKMKMIVELTQSHALKAALQQGRAFLQEGRADAARCRAAIHAIHQALEAIIAGLREELRRVAAGLSETDAAS